MTAPTIKLDTAEDIAYWLTRYRITPRQIRDWARRGKITRHPGDRYEARQIADYLDSRSEANHRRAVASYLRSGRRTATMTVKPRHP